MRLIKVRIKAGNINAGEDMLIYPSRYNPDEVDRQGGGTTRLNQLAVAMTGEIGRGEATEEYLYLALPDALAEEYALDPDMVIVDSTEANATMEQARINNNIAETITTDLEMVKLLREKEKTAEPLTQDELDILNPANRKKGINKGRYDVAETVTVDNDLSSLAQNLKEFQSA